MSSSSTEDLDRRVAALLRALEKLPPHRGVTFRGRSPAATFAREGQVVVTRELTATSRSVAVATENLTAPALYVVIGRTGRAIEQLSRHPEEREVVFLPGSMFSVVKSARIDDLPVTIVEQLDPEMGEMDEPLGTLQEIAAFAVHRVARAREHGDVEITTPGKFVGDIASPVSGTAVSAEVSRSIDEHGCDRGGHMSGRKDFDAMTPEEIAAWAAQDWADGGQWAPRPNGRVRVEHLTVPVLAQRIEGPGRPEQWALQTNMEGQP